jgi:hypothetical protein
MKFGDSVIFVRNGVEINALVVQSAQQADGEHLTLVYLDPIKNVGFLSGSQVQGSIATAFSVVPLVEGSKNGWQHFSTIDVPPVEAEKIDFITLTAEETLNSVRRQIIDEGKATIPDGANLQDFVDAVNAILPEIFAMKHPDVPSVEVPPVE